MKKFLTTATCCLVLCLLWRPSFAQDDLSLSDILDLGEVNVASNVITDFNKQPVSITRVTGDQIIKSGGRTLSEALAYLIPGYYKVNDQDDDIAGFRGMSPDNNSKTMLLVNGINLNADWFWGAPDSVLNSIALDYISHVDVIRGPGSVTLGQGALLGVINIVTKSARQLKAGDSKNSAVVNVGMDDYYQAHLERKSTSSSGNLKSYWSLSGGQYHGQNMRDQARASNTSYDTSTTLEGTKIADFNNLYRTYHSYLGLGVMEWGDWDFNFLYTNQKRMLYNWVRDRSVVTHEIISLGGEHKWKIHDKLKLSSKFYAAIDNYYLWDPKGDIETGGTQEMRQAFSQVLNWDRGRNKFAIGYEVKLWQSGRENFKGNNFIVNTVAAKNSTTDNNAERTWAVKNSFAAFGVFVEDFYSFSDNLDFFAAARWDQHPEWGGELTPRVGTLWSPNDDLSFRLTYQTGFRGAVGVHYSGGFLRDGLLREENFGAAKSAGLTGSLTDVDPEKIQSFELAGNYQVTKNLKIGGVGFYNKIENIIGVVADSNGVPSTLGSDVVGDWGGYFWFENLDGDLTTLGSEFEIEYKTDTTSLNYSYSYVKVDSVPLGVSNGVQSNIYVNSQSRFKGYPEQVSRLRWTHSPDDNWRFMLTQVYVHTWHSTDAYNVRIAGNFTTNLSVDYDINKNLKITGIAKNIFQSKQAEPIITVAGDATAAGTPANEDRTFFAKVTYDF